MPELDRELAGLRCRQVLALLGDYVDGGLAEAQTGQVDAHLRACDYCEKFGGEYSALVARLRVALAQRPLGSDGRARLTARLVEVWGGAPGGPRGGGAP